MLKKGGIIEPSQASHYSQVLLVPKPDGSSRMCINYIALNTCTPDVSFPIPNIRQLFVRMGTKKPTIFGIISNLSHSMISSSTINICNTCFHGIHNLLWSSSVYLLPIWVEGSTIIFSGNDGVYCIKWISLPYLWDVYWWLHCAWEYERRICFTFRSILERFRLHNLFLKASKCTLGSTELDFVGKVMWEEGLQMSHTTIQCVIDFPVLA